MNQRIQRSCRGVNAFFPDVHVKNLEAVATAYLLFYILGQEDVPNLSISRERAIILTTQQQ